MYTVRLKKKMIPNNFKNKLIFLQSNQPVWFQQDGSSVHSARIVTEYLDENFPGRWIGRHGPVKWPARSPDLTPLDFFYWGHIKSRLSKRAINGLDQLSDAIVEISEEISTEMLANTQRSFYDRLGYCLSVNGSHFEQHL